MESHTIGPGSHDQRSRPGGPTFNGPEAIARASDSASLLALALGVAGVIAWPGAVIVFFLSGSDVSQSGLPLGVAALMAAPVVGLLAGIGAVVIGRRARRRIRAAAGGNPAEEARAAVVLGWVSIVITGTVMIGLSLVIVVLLSTNEMCFYC